MDEFLFFITCTTCQARLKVRNEAAIGEILACPKCGSMVQVIPPPDWKPGMVSDDPAGEPGGPEPRQPQERGRNRDPRPAAQAQSNGPARDTTASPPPQGGDFEKPEPRRSPQAQQSARKQQSPRKQAARSVKPVPPPLPAMPPPAELAAGQNEGGAVAGEAPAGGEGPPPAGLAAAVAPAELLWRKWLLWAAAPAAVAIVAVGAWSIWSSGPEPQPGGQAVAVSKKPDRPADPSPVAGPVKQAAPAKLDRRWLPRDARLVVSLRLADLADSEEFRRMTSLADPAWQLGIGRVLETFGLRPDCVDRLTWASTELDDWPDRAVVAIELAEGQDATALRALGEPVKLQLGGADVRRPKDSSDAAWGHPFAILGHSTLVTGNEQLLRELADGPSKDGGEDTVIGRFLDAASPPPDFLLAVDLAAAREAHWRLPSWQMDVWPPGRDAWHVVWEMPRGLGLTYRRGDRVFSELALVCEGETAANQVRDAVGGLILAAKDTLAVKAASLTEALAAGKIAAEAADQYELLLEEGRNALAASQWEVVGETVWGRVDWGPKLSALATAVDESRPAARADWLGAARAGDEANHRRLLSGLSGYLKAEGEFPPGAGGGLLLPPETRLSWIASMLPYYDHRDWHRELDFGYSWNSQQNRSVTRRPLDAVVNPALGPSTSEAGFPVTHYVGVAGIGPNAGSLPAGDPRAGVFGFTRARRPEDVPDGLSNTIATLGVVGRLGPWGAGGDATVRALTKRPYVNGPDGFGSGQPDGMLVGMADGAVRFLSKDVDPEVVEQLATVGGHETTTIAALEPARSDHIDVVPPPAGQVGPDGKKPVAEGPSTASVPANRLARPLAAGVRPAQVPGLNGPSPPTQESIEARLAGRIAALELPGVPLADAVGLLSQLAGLPVAFDLDNMAVVGVGLDDPVTAKFAEVSIGEALAKALAGRRLVYVVGPGHLLVTTPEPKRNVLHEVRYPVSDLAGADLSEPEELADVVHRLVAPDTWRLAGGRGSIQAQGDSLAVSQTDPVQYQVLMLLERLRVARGIPVLSRGGQEVERFSRLAGARVTLQRPVTVNFHEPASLERIAGQLAAAADRDAEDGRTRIVIDWPGLAVEGVSSGVTGSVEVDGEPLSATLDELLQPLGLAYRVVGPETFEITTRKVLATRLEIELYPVGDLVDKAMGADELVEWVKGRVAGASWSDAGGPGVLYYDGPSRSLVVLQSQPVQGQLEAALAGLRASH